MYLKEHVAETRRLFIHWRANKQFPGERIPEALFERVAALSRSGVPHVDLSRTFGVGYAKIDKALERFPSADRSTLEKLHRNLVSERVHTKQCASEALQGHTQKASPSTGAPATQSASPKQRPEPSERLRMALPKDEKCPLPTAPRKIDPEPTAPVSPNCAIIQVIDADCVQRIREHRAVLSGENKPSPPPMADRAWGEMVSPQGARLILFEHIPLDILRTIIGTFLQVERGDAHATSQRH